MSTESAHTLKNPVLTFSGAVRIGKSMHSKSVKQRRELKLLPTLTGVIAASKVLSAMKVLVTLTTRERTIYFLGIEIPWYRQ